MPRLQVGSDIGKISLDVSPQLHDQLRDKLNSFSGVEVDELLVLGGEVVDLVPQAKDGGLQPYSHFGKLCRNALDMLDGVDLHCVASVTDHNKVGLDVDKEGFNIGFDEVCGFFHHFLDFIRISDAKVGKNINAVSAVGEECQVNISSLVARSEFSHGVGEGLELYKDLLDVSVTDGDEVFHNFFGSCMQDFLGGIYIGPEQVGGGRLHVAGDLGDETLDVGHCLGSPGDSCGNLVSVNKRDEYLGILNIGAKSSVGDLHDSILAGLETDKHVDGCLILDHDVKINGRNVTIEVSSHVEVLEVVVVGNQLASVY